MIPYPSTKDRYRSVRRRRCTPIAADESLALPRRHYSQSLNSTEGRNTACDPTGGAKGVKEKGVARSWRVRPSCGGEFGFVPARHPVLMATRYPRGCHFDRTPPSCHPERRPPLVIPSAGRPLVIPSAGPPLVIPSAAEGSGCEWEVRHVRRQMSRLRFAPLDMTKGTNSLVGMRSARPPPVRKNGTARFRPHPTPRHRAPRPAPQVPYVVEVLPTALTARTLLARSRCDSTRTTTQPREAKRPKTPHPYPRMVSETRHHRTSHP